MIARRLLVGAALAAPALRTAEAQEAVTFLLPAPAFLPAFAPHQLAVRRGHFAREGLNVTFQTGQGGANVATQVGAGNATLGGAVGETPMLVRPNGVPVRGVALLGGRPIYQLAVRRDANVADIPGLRGKRVGVIGFGDTGFYAMLGVLAAHRMRRGDLNMQAVGNAGMTQLMISGALDAVMAVPEWIDTIQEAGIAVQVYPIDSYFPAMAQAILASDATVARRPEQVRGFVRAVLRSVTDMTEDPAAAARDYVAHIPQHAGREGVFERIIRRYATDVYPTEAGTPLGRFDAARLKRVQDFYVENEILRAAAPVEDLYSNAFVG